SSLKSSSSSPNIPDMLRTKHLRAQSAPSTPNVHKNVHFDENGLESVRLFNRTGKPSSVSKPPGDETETETEAETSNAERGISSFPFPSLSSSSLGLSMPSSASSQNIVHEIDTAPHMTSSIPSPSPSPPPQANVHLETVTLPRTRPPTLRGTVLVRNLAFEKNVAVRFTLDEWQTTSEHEKREEGVDSVAGRIVSGRAVEEESVASWDRFSFTIRLEDYETKLSDRTLWLVARFNCPTGEWWDNNSAANYRIGFRKALATPSLSPLSTPVPASISAAANKDKESRGVVIPSLATLPAQQWLSPVSASQQRTFNAPSSMRFTPTTGTLAGIPVVSSGKGSLAPPVLLRSMSSPYPPSPSFGVGMHNNNNRPPSPSPLAIHPPQHTPRPTSPTARETAAQTSSYIRKRLSLSNYVAPGNSPTEERKDLNSEGSSEGAGVGVLEKQQMAAKEVRGLVTPPTTPPGTVRMRIGVLPPTPSPPLPHEGRPPSRRASPPPPVPADENDEEIGEIPSEQEDELELEHEQEEEEDEDDTPKDEKSLRLDTSSLPLPLSLSTTADTSSSSPTKDQDASFLLPFSPTSVKASPRPFLPFNPGGYLSPPTSRDASEDGGSGEAGRTSPTIAPVPVPVVDNVPSVGAAQRPPSLVLPDLGLSFAQTHLRQPAEHSLEEEDESTPSGVAGGRVDTSDSSYAAFVRQWCFAQSAPPTPGVHSANSPRNQSSASPTLLSGGAGPGANGLVNGGGGAKKGGPWLGLGMGMGLGGDLNHGSYGFPGFGFGVGAGAGQQDVGMVGAHMRRAKIRRRGQGQLWSAGDVGTGARVREDAVFGHAGRLGWFGYHRALGVLAGVSKILAVISSIARTTSPPPLFATSLSPISPLTAPARAGLYHYLYYILLKIFFDNDTTTTTAIRLLLHALCTSSNINLNTISYDLNVEATYLFLSTRPCSSNIHRSLPFPAFRHLDDDSAATLYY
ncbi:hypothetical protein EIP91_005330, partial [Steccherinum ochraceum]